MPQHRLFQYLNQFITLSLDELSLIHERLEIRRFETNEFILKAGETETYFNFIDKGVVQKYYIKGKQKIVRQIGEEGDILMSAVSFVASTPSLYYIEALEPCVLISLNKNAFEKFYSYSERFEKLGRLLITDWLLQAETQEYERMSLTPRERFIKFMKEKPDLAKKVPQKLIASFLDIQPETFSRYKILLKQ